MTAYLTVAEADTYFSSRLYASAWNSASDAQRIAALEMATEAIDNLPLKGVKYLDLQLLQFPRAYYIENGWITDIDSNLGAIPDRVKKATAEEALALLEWGNSSRLQLREQGVKSFRLGSTGLQEDYLPLDRGRLLSNRAMSFLQPFLAMAIPYG